LKIEIRNISFKYNKKSPMVLEDTSYIFEGGNIYFLEGKNGAGKTTLGKIIMGLLEPNSGSLLFDEEDAAKIKPADRAKKIGYIFQNPALQIFAPTVYDELAFPYEIMGLMDESIREKIEESLKKFNLLEAKDRSPLAMSYGEMQRLALAGISLRDVEFLILDEPSSALDDDGRKFLVSFLKDFSSNGGGIILISHDEDTLSNIENIKELRLDDKKIISIEKSGKY